MSDLDHRLASQLEELRARAFALGLHIETHEPEPCPANVQRTSSEHLRVPGMASESDVMRDQLEYLIAHRTLDLETTERFVAVRKALLGMFA